MLLETFRRKHEKNVDKVLMVTDSFNADGAENTELLEIFTTVDDFPSD